MDITEARAFLDTCVRDELRDHAFGDREVTWTFNGVERASGYYGGGEASLGIYGPGGPEDGSLAEFYGKDARNLSSCGAKGVVERNDMTGPDEFEEGACMPGLTVEGVRTELTGGGL